MDNIGKALQAFKDMSSEEAGFVLKKLLDDEVVDFAPIMVLYAQHLQDFKRKAKSDIYKMSEAGLSLAEKKIKSIPSIKSDSSRRLALAQAKTLISGRGFFETKFIEDLNSRLNFAEIDDKWYQECWALRTVAPKPESEATPKPPVGDKK